VHHSTDVADGSNSAVSRFLQHGCFTPETGHCSARLGRQKGAKSRLMQRSKKSLFDQRVGAQQELFRNREVNCLARCVDEALRASAPRSTGDLRCLIGKRPKRFEAAMRNSTTNNVSGRQLREARVLAGLRLGRISTAVRACARYGVLHFEQNACALGGQAVIAASVPAFGSCW
jgi:hypothetical protein